MTDEAMNPLRRRMRLVLFPGGPGKEHKCFSVPLEHIDDVIGYVVKTVVERTRGPDLVKI